MLYAEYKGGPGYMRLEVEVLQAEYKKEAKKADARLRALEDAARKYKDDKYLEYAYRKAQRELNSLGLGNRFDKVLNDPKQLQKALVTARDFNRAETATMSGFERLDSKRLSTLKEKDWFPDMSEREFLKITQLGVWDLLSEDFGFGYQTAIKIAKALTKNKKYIMSRKSKMTKQRMEDILSKYKFRSDPELLGIVQGVLNR